MSAAAVRWSMFQRGSWAEVALGKRVVPRSLDRIATRFNSGQGCGNLLGRADPAANPVACREVGEEAGIFRVLRNVADGKEERPRQERPEEHG